jgi:hypothetical protein
MINKEKLAEILTDNAVASKTKKKYSKSDISDEMVKVYDTAMVTLLKKYPEFDVDSDDYNGKEDDEFIDILSKVAKVGGYELFEEDESEDEEEESEIEITNESLGNIYTKVLIEKPNIIAVLESIIGNHLNLTASTNEKMILKEGSGAILKNPINKFLVENDISIEDEEEEEASGSSAIPTQNDPDLGDGQPIKVKEGDEIESDDMDGVVIKKEDDDEDDYMLKCPQGVSGFSHKELCEFRNLKINGKPMKIVENQIFADETNSQENSSVDDNTNTPAADTTDVIIQDDSDIEIQPLDIENGDQVKIGDIEGVVYKVTTKGIEITTDNGSMKNIAMDSLNVNEECELNGRVVVIKEGVVYGMVKINEYAVSVAQQQLFGSALSVKRGDIKISDVPDDVRDEIKNIVDSMTEEEIKKIASTPHKDLPNRVGENRINEEKFSIVLVSKDHGNGKIDGTWVQDHVGTLDSAIKKAADTSKANGDKNDYAVVAQLGGGSPNYDTKINLKRLDEAENTLGIKKGDKVIQKDKEGIVIGINSRTALVDFGDERILDINFDKFSSTKTSGAFSVDESVIMNESLKGDIKKAFPKMKDDEFDSHESDLYVKWSPEVMKWIENNYEHGKSKSIVSTFISDTDKKKWIEINFANTNESIMNESLKGDIKKAFPKMTDKDFDSYKSDLYVKWSPEVMKWIESNYEHGKSKSIVSTFISDTDKSKWIEINFANTDESIMNESLKGDIKKAFPKMTDKDFDSYKSDLYVKWSPEVMKWIESNYEHGKSKSIVSTFISDTDKSKWIEINFANTNEGKDIEPIVGDKAIKNGKEGIIKSIKGDMAQVDFGDGDVYGIVLRRFSEKSKDGIYTITESKDNPYMIGKIELMDGGSYNTKKFGKVIFMGYDDAVEAEGKNYLIDNGSGVDSYSKKEVEKMFEGSSDKNYYYKVELLGSMPKYNKTIKVVTSDDTENAIRKAVDKLGYNDFKINSSTQLFDKAEYDKLPDVIKEAKITNEEKLKFSDIKKGDYLKRDGRSIELKVIEVTKNSVTLYNDVTHHSDTFVKLDGFELVKESKITGGVKEADGDNKSKKESIKKEIADLVTKRDKADKDGDDNKGQLIRQDIKNLRQYLEKISEGTTYKKKYTNIDSSLALRIQSQPTNIKGVSIEKLGRMYSVIKDDKEIATLADDTINTDLSIDSLKAIMGINESSNKTVTDSNGEEWEVRTQNRDGVTIKNTKGKTKTIGWDEYKTYDGAVLEEDEEEELDAEEVKPIPTFENFRKQNKTSKIGLTPIPTFEEYKRNKKK